MQKDYDQNNLLTGEQTSEDTLESLQYGGSLAQFIKRTYQLLFASMVCASIGAYIGFNYITHTSPFLFLILEIAVLVGMNFAVSARNDNLALVLLFAFTLITGISIGPILSLIVKIGKTSAITGAFLTTACMFAGLSLYTFKTKRDFSMLGKPLFFALIGIIIGDLLNLLFFKSSAFALAISSICVLVFSLYIIYDTQRIIRGEAYSPILEAANMYLNVFNLFISLLQIFTSFSDSDNS